MSAYAPAKYRLRMTTISPLHIGTGRTLLENADYIYRNREYWVVNVDRFIDKLDAEGNDLKLSRFMAGSGLDEIVEPGDFDPQIMYRAKGPPATTREIREQMKNAWSQPYIPGSTLKGVLRTVLGFQGWTDRGLHLETSKLKGRAREVALPLERRIFNPAHISASEAPNYDVLKAIQITDTRPDTKQRLGVVHVRVLSNGNNRGDAFLEIVPPNVTFSAFLTVDGFFMQSPDALKEMNWDERHFSLLDVTSYPRLISAYTEARLQRELQRWEPSADPIRDFYLDTIARVHQERDEATECVLQIGWGTGWDSKTFASKLMEDENEFDELVTRYRIIHRGNFNPRWHVPKSKRLVMRDNDGALVPTYTLGWVKLKIEQVA